MTHGIIRFRPRSWYVVVHWDDAGVERAVTEDLLVSPEPGMPGVYLLPAARAAALQWGLDLEAITIERPGVPLSAPIL